MSHMASLAALGTHIHFLFVVQLCAENKNYYYYYIGKGIMTLNLTFNHLRVVYDSYKTF